MVDVHERLVPHEQRAHDLQRRDLQREVEWLRAQAVPKIRVLGLGNLKPKIKNDYVGFDDAMSGIGHNLAGDAHARNLPWSGGS